MKVAFIGQKGIPSKSGGVERHVEELATELVSLGHEVFVYARKGYEEREIAEYRGIKIISLPSIPTKNLDAITHTFLASIHALFSDYDVVHYHAIGPSSLSWIIKLFKRKTGLVSTFHCRDYQHEKWGKLAKIYLKIGEFVTCKIPDKTITVSKELAKYANNKYKSNAVVIPNGAKVRYGTGLGYVNKWGLEKGKYILSVSRLIKHKGLHHLINAFKKLKTEGGIPSGWKLVIVGDGFHTDEYVDYLHALAKEDSDILFVGNQEGEDLNQIFLNAAFFVQPSKAEGLSVALLEAMGCGLAPLISDIKANIEAAGVSGFCFQSENVDDLKEKMKKMIESPDKVKEASILAQKRIQQKFNWKVIAKKTEKVYKNCFK